MVRPTRRELADAQADLFVYLEVVYNRSRHHYTLGFSSTARS